MEGQQEKGVKETIPQETEDKEDCPICCDALPKLSTHFTRLVCCGKGLHHKCSKDLHTNTFQQKVTQIFVAIKNLPVVAKV